MQRFPLGLHIPLDDLREWVVSGIAHPLPTWADETTRQFRLAYQAAASIARLYAGAGFAVVIEQVIYPADASAFLLPQLAPHSPHKIFLSPSVEVALERNARRDNKAFDTHMLADPIRAMHQPLADQIAADAGWLVIENSALSLKETVEEILNRSGLNLLPALELPPE